MKADSGQVGETEGAVAPPPPNIKSEATSRAKSEAISGSKAGREEVNNLRAENATLSPMNGDRMHRMNE